MGGNFSDGRGISVLGLLCAELGGVGAGGCMGLSNFLERSVLLEPAAGGEHLPWKQRVFAQCLSRT